MSPSPERFVPGSYWTPQRARDAREQARTIAESMRPLMQAIADASSSDGDPASMAAALSGVDQAPKRTLNFSRDACLFRRGTAGDIGALQRLIVDGHLPPFYVEPFIEGFLVVECDGEIIGCGGNEHYDEFAVLRSVVVDERVRGTGLGAEIARLLIEDARASGATDLYLLTMEAHHFWLRLGFADVPFDDWPKALHEQWQYAFCVSYPEAAREVHGMWMPAAA